MSKCVLLSKMPLALDIVEKNISKLDVVMKEKLLPRVSGELKASTVSALEAQLEFLSVARKYHNRMDNLIKGLELCAEAKPSGGTKIPDASRPDDHSMTSRDDPNDKTAPATRSQGSSATNQSAAPNGDQGLTGNAAHDRVSRLPKAEQVALLSKAIPCTGTDAFFMGMGPQKEAFWSLRCADGKSYAVSLALKVADSKVIECSVLSAVGAGACFKKFSGQ